MPCTRHRVFLATLIVTAKYLNDSSPKNIHWSNYAVLFEVAEINLMEKQLLYLLDYDLRFNEEDVCKLFAPFMVPSESKVKARSSAVIRVAKAGKARADAQQQSQGNAQLLPTPSDEMEQPLYPAQAHLAPASSASSASATTTFALSSAVRGIARRLSTAHLRPSAPASNMYSSLSTDSSSTASSSSDLASLVDDTGSSSSSSGWTSNEEDSEEQMGESSVGIVEPSSSSSNLGRQGSTIAPLAGPGTMRKQFSLRPAPPSAYKVLASPGKNDLTPTRARKASDTSSLHTVTASPTVPRKSQPSLRVANGKRSVSLTKKTSMASLSGLRESRISSSSTMPAIAQSSGASLGTSTARLRSGTIVQRPSVVSKTASVSAHQTHSNSALLSTPTRAGVGAIISRMWGAAAANLKVGTGVNPAHTPLSGVAEAEAGSLVANVDGVRAC